MIRHIFCLLSLVFVSGVYFFLNLLDDYLSIDNPHDNFYFDLLPLFVFLIIAAGALIGLIVGLFRYPRQPAVLICRLLFVICAGASIWFRHDLILMSDRTFFWMNESYFREKVRAASGAAISLHRQSSVNFQKEFIYTGSRPLADGPVSQEKLNSLAAAFDALDAGCRVDAKALKDNFYVLYIYCG